jgi:PIN domain nuclease of toxin-antitoxin system
MIVLDTHTWWWAVSEPEQLSSRAIEIINTTPSGQRCIASISLWEFAMMVSRGKIHLRVTPREWFYHAISEVGTKVLPLSADIAIDSCNLPGNFHRDPADRIIVATARIYHAVVITRDQKIRDYPHVQAIW